MSNHFSTGRTLEVSPAIPARRTGAALGEGAALAAPTAPHATLPEEPRDGSRRPRRRSGPERFWSKGPVRAALTAAIVLSAMAHGAFMPLGVPPGFALKDVEGEVAIPIDLLDSNEPAEPPPPAEAPPPLPAGEARPDPESAAGVAARRDAGAHGSLDAGHGLADAGHDVADAALRANLDAAAEARSADGGRDGGRDEGPDEGKRGNAEIADAGAGAGSGDAGEPSDPHAVGGAVAAIQPAVINVVLVINAEVIRRHPVGAKLGTLLRGIPQWDDFMSGTTIDPVRDTDWFMVSGPSLVNTERDVVLIHYSAPDGAIDRAISIVGHKYVHGGPVDAGVPGVRAVLAHADRAERVILRPQSRLLAVVPPAEAAKVARQLVSARVKPPIAANEAVFLRLVKPQRPLPELPGSISELRLRVVPRSDDGADVYAEGDTPDPAEAASAVEAVTRMVRRHNDVITSIVTHGLLDHVEVTSEGPRVKLHLSATLDQIQTLADVVSALLGIAPTDPAAPRSAPSLPPIRRVPSPASH